MVFDEAAAGTEVGVPAAVWEPQRGIERGARLGGECLGARGELAAGAAPEPGDDVESADPQAAVIGDEALAIDIVGPVAVVARFQRQAGPLRVEADIAVKNRLDDRP